MVYFVWNFGSFIFGVLAWVFSFLALKKLNQKKDVQAMRMLYTSLVSAIVSLLAVIMYILRLVHLEEWSSLLDIASGFQVTSIVLSVVVVVVNGITLNFIAEKLDKEAKSELEKEDSEEIHGDQSLAVLTAQANGVKAELQPDTGRGR